MALFKNALHEDFGTWPIAYIPYGGADYGEIRAVAEAIADGDDEAYYNAWCDAAARLQEEARTTLAKGHVTSARELYLRASVFYATSFHPLYGAPVDPRLLEAFRHQVAAFDQALALGPCPVAPQRIPFEGTSLPAYFIPAERHETEVRPLIIFNNGYDATITDMYFASAVAASRRGYHSLLFDGPGQGEMLYEQQLALRPDWENVITAVMDFAVAHPLVEPSKIALSGWSLGGYLAPRAASAERRIAALIADPGSWGIADGFRKAIRHMFDLPPEAVQNLGELDQAIIDQADVAIRHNRQLNWKIVLRGFWVHGVDNLRDYLTSAETFSMAGRAERIQCPTLLTQAEHDPLAADAQSLFDALRCPKTLMRFSAAEGGDGHCEMQNRSLINRRALDWLDEQFKVTG